MRAQQLNTIDIDVETNCITRPRRSELTCSAHDCCAAVLIRQCQWAAAEYKTNHDPGGSSRHGVTWPAHLCFYAVEQVGAWEQESSKFPQRAEGRISSFRIITFAAAFCWQDATQRAHVCSDSNCNDCSKILFVSFASFLIWEQLFLNWAGVSSLVWCVLSTGLHSLQYQSKVWTRLLMQFLFNLYNFLDCR